MSLWGPIFIVNHHKEQRTWIDFFFKTSKISIQMAKPKWKGWGENGTYTLVMELLRANSSCFIFVANAWRRKYLFKLISVHGQPSQDSDVMTDGIFEAELLTSWQRRIWRTKYVFQIHDPCKRGFQRGCIISFTSPDSTREMDTKPLTLEPVGAHYLQAL